MANAKRCDRCQMYFSPLEAEGEMVCFENPRFVTSESIRNHQVAYYLLSSEYRDAMVDLCPCCTEDFKKFMGGYSLLYKDLDDAKREEEEYELRSHD